MAKHRREPGAAVEAVSATRGEIAEWFDNGVTVGAAFMLVVCDTFDHSDYPTYVMPGEDVRVRVRECNDGPGRMAKVVEVYALGRDKAAQLAEDRAWAEEVKPC